MIPFPLQRGGLGRRLLLPAAAAGGQTAWSPTDKNAGVTLSNANRRATIAGGGGVGRGARAASGKSSGKWYMEILIATASSEFFVAVATSSATLNGISDATNIGGNFYMRTSGGLYTRAGAILASGVGGMSVNDRIGFSVDFDAAIARGYRNGSLINTYTGFPAGTYFPYINSFNSVIVMDLPETPVHTPAGFAVWT